MNATEKSLVDRLAASRRETTLPPETRRNAIEVGECVLGILFPQYAECTDCDEAQIEAELVELRRRLEQFRSALDPSAPQIADEFIGRLGVVLDHLRSDAETMFHGDPAARTVDEVILAYPGFRAIATFRVAHELHDLKVPLLPRLLTEWAHSVTGIDIHPGATIGRNFVIDHGTGVVVGETALIGNGVKLYQGVTLGAMVVEKGLQSVKRHPTIEDNVVIYANATILGGETVVGHDSIVGGNAFVTSSVPAFSIVNRQSVVQRRTSKGDDALDFHI
jgi:serine O-acetyltransferase